ncbi:hypothetical protein [Actinotalea sp. K2]|uniref:hypothetical protein n=1 Tax=Actinotalea sp. K2 TaxID=2939438 RepID=UPI002017935C|nr:hypothetical protein [Actinotalea sp. K2]MCL3862478.1 hypothetical protein [Actinotalea sp. K2]
MTYRPGDRYRSSDVGRQRLRTRLADALPWVVALLLVGLIVGRWAVEQPGGLPTVGVAPVPAPEPWAPPDPPPATGTVSLGLVDPPHSEPALWQVVLPAEIDLEAIPARLVERAVGTALLSHADAEGLHARLLAVDAADGAVVWAELPEDIGLVPLAGARLSPGGRWVAQVLGHRVRIVELSTGVTTDLEVPGVRGLDCRPDALDVSPDGARMVVVSSCGDDHRSYAALHEIDVATGLGREVVVVPDLWVDGPGRVHYSPHGDLVAFTGIGLGGDPQEDDDDWYATVVAGTDGTVIRRLPMTLVWVHNPWLDQETLLVEHEDGPPFYGLHDVPSGTTTALPLLTQHPVGASHGRLVLASGATVERATDILEVMDPVTGTIEDWLVVTGTAGLSTGLDEATSWSPAP